MRKHTKNRCTELIRTIEEAHIQIINFINEGNISTATVLLGECQDAAVAIGNLIEAQEGEGTEAVKLLEEYCETLYHINEDITKEQVNSSKDIEKRLKKEIRQIQSSIKTLPTRVEAVFMPYNATMWDSLESIWMAADADDNCDAYVVPIPYYDRNPDGSFAKYNYDFDKYPDYVPVINHEEFNLSEHYPDIIFIHNPYDEYNFVTSVHPNYYSYSLKKYTDCLVYVPYFATSGMMSEGQALLSAYLHSDYIVVQSKEMIEQYDKSIPREKFLPLGSPKFDRVIKLCNNPPEPPAEWAGKMKGKRVFFYNTSIGGMLDDTRVWLDKLQYVFETFKGVDDACLLWRPHPLLETSMESMRDEHREEYENLKASFIEDGIGILDATSDIEKSIALSDAYIGDAGTSVLALFGVVGKPIFILNNGFTEPPKDDDWKAWVHGSVRGDRNDEYTLLMGNRLFKKSELGAAYNYCTSLPNEYSGGGYYGAVIKAEDKVILFPANAENILVMNPQDYSFRKIDLKHETDRAGAFVGSINDLLSDHSDIFYLLPNRYPSLVRFDANTETVDYIRDEAFSDEYSVYTNEKMERIVSVRFFRNDEGFLTDTAETKDAQIVKEQEAKMIVSMNGKSYSFSAFSRPNIPGINMKGPRLICIDKTGKRMRAIQLETGEVQERSIPLDGIYTGVFGDAKEPNVLWFLPYRGTILVKWDLLNDTWDKVDAFVDGLISLRRPQRYICDEYFFSGGIFHKEKLILAPKWGNKFVEIDTYSHEAKEWVPPFPFTTEDRSIYWKNGHMGYFFRDIYDYSPFFYYVPEHILFKLDLYKNTAIAKEFSFDKEEVYGLSLGFHRESQWLPYCCFEDVFNPLGDFIRNNVHGAQFDKDIQIKTFKGINASPKGDCGDKVFERLKREIGI